MTLNFKFNTLVCLTIFIFTSSAVAQKDPKSKEAAVPEIETDPLKKELKPGEIFNCEVDIFVEWESTRNKDDKKKNKEFIETLVEKGKDGPLCKSRLESRISDSKNKALLKCKQDHSVSDCNSNKLIAAKNDLMSLDFQAKRMLTSNILQACEDNAGNCIESSNSDIRCQVYRSPDALMPKESPPPAAPAGKK